MSYDEERQRKSRVVVETPTARREEYYTQTRRVPPERGGYSLGVVAAVALTAIALTALVVFFLMNMGSDTTDANVSVVTAPTPVATVPTPFPTVPTPLPTMMQQQPPTIIVQPPATTTQPAPVIVAPPAATPASAALNDADIESKVNRALTDDAELGPLGLSVTVINGRLTLNGLVKTPDLKARAEQLARKVPGVRAVDNKIIVE